MKWCLPVLLFSFTVNYGLRAQQTYVIKPGERINEVLPFEQIYSYPNFINGTVVFQDGKTSNGKLNYNLVVAEIQFIDAKGDTLSLANESTIGQVLIAKDTFVFSNGYIKLISSNPAVKLGERAYFKDFKQNAGAYGLSTATSAANSADQKVDPRRVTVNREEEITLIKHTDYFFSGTHDVFFVADKKNLSKAFPRYNKEIANYVNSNPVDFKSPVDLQRLCLFISGLAK